MTVQTLDLSAGAAADFAARRIIAGALAMGLRDPAGDAAAQEGYPPADLLSAAWDALAAPHAAAARSSLGLGEIVPIGADPGPLARWLAQPINVRRAAYREVFGLVFSKECPPYETEYCDSKDTFHRSQQMADIGGFYRAFGLRPDARSPERTDHASLMIGFVSFLLERLSRLASDPTQAPGASEHESIVRDALASFVRDHLVRWMPAFGRALELRAQRLSDATDDPPMRAALADLAGVGRLLRAWVAAERLSAGVEAPRRIVEPSLVAPEPEEDSCASACAGCGETGDATPEGR